MNVTLAAEPAILTLVIAWPSLMFLVRFIRGNPRPKGRKP